MDRLTPGKPCGIIGTNCTAIYIGPADRAGWVAISLPVLLPTGPLVYIKRDAIEPIRPFQQEELPL